MVFFEQLKNFKTGTDASYGYYQDFLMTYKSDNPKNHVFTFALAPAEDEMKAALEAFAAQNAPYISFEFPDGAIKLIVSDKKKNLPERLEAALAKIKELEIPAVGGCSICGEDSGEFAYADGNIKNICPRCIEIEESKFRDSQKFGEGSAARGFIGALLGAVVGTIPYFAVAYATEKYYAILGIVIGYAAFFGYKLFAGKRSKTAAMISIITASLLATIFMNVVLDAYTFYSTIVRELNLSGYGQYTVLGAMEIFPIDGFLKMYTGNDFYKIYDPITFSENMRGIWLNMLICLGIAAIGVTAVISLINKFAAEKKFDRITAYEYSDFEIGEFENEGFDETNVSVDSDIKRIAAAEYISAHPDSTLFNTYADPDPDSDSDSDSDFDSAQEDYEEEYAETDNTDREAE